MVPSGATLRTTQSPPSAMYVFPAASVTDCSGVSRRAEVAGPPSPFDGGGVGVPGAPVPANALIVPGVGPAAEPTALIPNTEPATRIAPATADRRRRTKTPL